MSSNTDDTAEGRAPEPDAIDADPEPAEGRAASRPSASPPPRRGGGVLGGMALVLALAALGLSGWLFYQAVLEPADPQSSVDQARLERVEQQVDQLTALEQSVGNLDAELAALERRQASEDERLGRIEQRLDSRDGQMAPLEQGLGRVDERTEALARQVGEMEQQLADRTAEAAELRRRLEAAVEQLDARGDLEREADRDLRQQMVMLEAASLLRVGQDLAEVHGNVGEARRAFERARTRLEATENARLDPVRRTLAREIEALAAHRGPDLDAELARLERLGRESRAWPLQLPGAEPEAEAAEEGEGWRGRVGRTLARLVRVESRDALGRDEEQFEAAREELRLRLLAAELALLRRDAAALGVQLEAAIDLLEEWFDGAAEPVAAARQEFQRLAGLDLNPDPPALGAALEQLQARLDEA